MTYTQNFGFGSGVMFGTPAGGGTPVRLGVLQEVSVDVSFTTKELFGQYQFPVAIGRGTAKITGKAKFGRIDTGALASLFFNQPTVVGQSIIADAEAHTIPASTPWQVTVTNSTSFTEDLGVNYATTGQPFVKVASSPAAGQYSVAAGVYTFATADASAAVLISYGYTPSSPAVGTQMTINNQFLGAATAFQTDFYQNDPTLSQQWGLRLFSCQSSKLTLATKLEDFTIPEFDFAAYANAANQIGILNFPN